MIDNSFWITVGNYKKLTYFLFHIVKYILFAVTLIWKSKLTQIVKFSFDFSRTEKTIFCPFAKYFPRLFHLGVIKIFHSGFIHPLIIRNQNFFERNWLAIIDCFNLLYSLSENSFIHFNPRWINFAKYLYIYANKRGLHFKHSTNMCNKLNFISVVNSDVNIFF